MHGLGSPLGHPRRMRKRLGAKAPQGRGLQVSVVGGGDVEVGDGGVAMATEAWEEEQEHEYGMTWYHKGVWVLHDMITGAAPVVSLWGGGKRSYWWVQEAWGQTPQ